MDMSALNKMFILKFGKAVWNQFTKGSAFENMEFAIFVSFYSFYV